MWIENVIEQQYRIVKVLKKMRIKKSYCLRTRRIISVLYAENILKRYAMKYTKTDQNISTQFVEGIWCTEKEDKTIVLEEYIDGISVAELLNDSTYTPYAMKRVINSVCNGVEVLHNNSIIHRDIKPDNILVDSNGNIKLIDYDAARIYIKGKEQDTVLLGTAGYAAPEQYGIVQSDIRTDIYSLGVLINVMLTGEHPSKKMCSGRYRKIVEKCTRINPDDRYHNISELRKHL